MKKSTHDGERGLRTEVGGDTEGLTTVIVWVQIMYKTRPALAHERRDGGVARRLAREFIREITQAQNIVVHEGDFDVVRYTLVDGRAVGDHVEAVRIRWDRVVGPCLVGVAAAGQHGVVGRKGRGAFVLEADGAAVRAAGESGREAQGGDVGV